MLHFLQRTQIEQPMNVGSLARDMNIPRSKRDRKRPNGSVFLKGSTLSDNAISFKIRSRGGSIVIPQEKIVEDELTLLTKKRHIAQNASCTVTPIHQIGGERRAYRGLAQPFAAHSHRHYVIGRVEEGERNLDLNGRHVRIGPGDLIVFNPGDVHGCRHASDEPFAYDSVTIAAEVLDGAQLRFPAREDRTALRAFDDLLRSIEGEDSAEILERALFLASCLDAGEAHSSHPTAHEESALRVFAHLCGHLAEPYAIAELAAMEGLSEYALIRAYRKKFSITPLQHLMSLRVECACELLSAGAAPVDVAVETGFADQAHLTRVFKQRIGTTPAAYRRMVAKGGIQE